MAVTRNELIGRPAGIYDFKTNSALLVEHAVEITEETRSSVRGFIFYTSSRKGKIVQLAYWWPGKTGGFQTHFYLDKKLDKHHSSIIFVAHRLFISADSLYGMILANAPSEWKEEEVSAELVGA